MLMTRTGNSWYYVISNDITDLVLCNHSAIPGERLFNLFQLKEFVVYSAIYMKCGDKIWSSPFG